MAPLLITWMTAFKTGEQVLFEPFALPSPLALENLSQVWVRARFDVYFLNSVLISTASVIGTLIASSLAGYAFGRLRFPGQRVLLILLLLGMTIPIAAIIIPLYLVMRDFHLLDTYWSVIVAHVAIGVPVFTFMMRGFFKGLPRELDDAARVDGCSELQVFWDVMLPLARPGLLTVALLQFLWSWNALLLPLVFLTKNSLRTMPVGLLLFQGRSAVQWELMSAGVLLMSVPVVIMFVLLQRSFVRGLTSGSVKG
ncbi:MAG: carbohydrate ABC transporter permease [Chloroflexi bacterium]|nr:carbohydrate ABC transporter permease [Chloroflexota bacterium]